MPVDAYDKWFGAKEGSANKALTGLVKQYGAAEGTRVFYALLNDRKEAKKTYGRRGRN